MKVDVVIAGASFAGLGLAYHLRDSGLNVLVIDNKEIGGNRASTCGMPKYIADEMAPNAVLHSVKKFYIETPRVSGILNIPLEYCVIDYRKFCEELFRKSGARFMRAEALDPSPTGIYTSKGFIDAGFIVDCTGWRRALSKGQPEFHKLFSGVEITAPVHEKYLDKLNFFFDKRRIPGYGWVFPIGGGLAHVGIGGYCLHTSLSKAFSMFLKHVNVEFTRDGLMSGAVPCTGLAKPYDGDIFLVGDSARQVLPLTAEGIRTALLFSRVCANIIKDVSMGKISLKDGLKRYEMQVNCHRFGFATMRMLQHGVLNAPQLFSDTFAFCITKTPIGGLFTNFYLSIAKY